MKFKRDIFQSLHSSEKALGFDSEHKLRSENLPFDIDVWYPRLKQFTFPTYFLPLARREARAIVRYYRTRFLNDSILTTTDREVLRTLECKLDVLVKEHFAENGCFMRLCGRSAKDAEPYDRERVKQEYKHQLELLMHQEGHSQPIEDLPGEVRMRAIGKVNLLKAKSGKEVMSLLLSSERVHSDMLDWLWFGEPEQVVLRGWKKEISVDYEFRCYVFNGKLCAISQYDHYCCYPYLYPRKAEFEAKIKKLWANIHSHVGVDAYCMDFCYLPSRDDFVLIELSPFLPCTGAHAFRWTNKNDNAILHGIQPFEFRLIESTTADFDIMVESGWEKRWRTEGDQPHFWQVYETKETRLKYEKAYQKHLLYFSCFKNFISAHALIVSYVIGLCASLLLFFQMNFLFSIVCSFLMELQIQYLLFRLLFPSRRHVLFVYGTLKRNMHWNQKFLSNSSFFHCATTLDRFPLVIGKCGVPYLLGGEEVKGQGKYVRGEVWLVDDETLENLDEYEGLAKGYYQRKSVRVSLSSWVFLPGKTLNAQVYVLASAPSSLRSQEYLEEYTLQMHKDRYRAVEHILLKQQMYLAGVLKYSSTSSHPATSVETDAEMKS